MKRSIASDGRKVFAAATSAGRRLRASVQQKHSPESAVPALADLFPGVASAWIDTKGGRIFARVGGDGPPLLLLHGYPQTHVTWHKVAPLLAKKFALVIP